MDRFRIQDSKKDKIKLLEMCELINFRIDETVQEDPEGTWAGHKDMFSCLMDIKSLIRHNLPE